MSSKPFILKVLPTVWAMFKIFRYNIIVLMTTNNITDEIKSINHRQKDLVLTNDCHLALIIKLTKLKFKPFRDRLAKFKHIKALNWDK